jgi:hypothetical protein
MPPTRARRDTLASRFLLTAKRRWSSFCMADSTGRELFWRGVLEGDVRSAKCDAGHRANGPSLMILKSVFLHRRPSGALFDHHLPRSRNLGVPKGVMVRACGVLANVDDARTRCFGHVRRCRSACCRFSLLRYTAFGCRSSSVRRRVVH